MNVSTIQKKNPALVKRIKKMGWFHLYEEFGIKYRRVKNNGRSGKLYWTLERCLESALKYKTQFDWWNNDKLAYQAASYHKDWMDECTKHFIPGRKRRNWNLLSAIENAKKFSTRSEWIEAAASKKKRKVGDPSSYNACRRNPSWMEECNKIWGLLNDADLLNACKKSASKYTTRKEWRKAEYYYWNQANKREGWLEQCMKSEFKSPGYWNFQRCLTEAKQWGSVKKWGHCTNRYRYPYTFAKKNDWLDLISEKLSETRK